MPNLTCSTTQFGQAASVTGQFSLGRLKSIVRVSTVYGLVKRVMFRSCSKKIFWTKFLKKCFHLLSHGITGRQVEE